MQKIKILIVDDYPENIQALSELITSEDVEVFSASNATAALELVAKHEFGLALLDVQMPETGGFELASIIRGVDRFKSLPIIFVTAQSQNSSFLFQGYKTGAVDVLFKPLNTDMVRAKVQVFVEMAQQKIRLQEQVKELEKLREEAHAANLAKSQFLANMSHEIRTPLSAVMGFADLIVHGQIMKDEIEACSEAIRRNGLLLMRLIDDILDVSKIEANKLELESQPFRLSELLHDVESTMSFRAREKGVALHFQSRTFEPDVFSSDATRIKQVLLNIIGNAIKFTRPGGSVDVETQIEDGVTPANGSAAAAPRTAGTKKLSILVRDNGIGLSPEQIERLFQPFSQADASMKRKFGGSGLGLTISRQIARATGGNLQILSSSPGQGTSFLIEIGLREVVASDLTQVRKRLQDDTKRSDEGTLKGLRILAVDDSPDNLTLLTLYLKKAGAGVVCTDSPERAIAEAKAGAFDCILMDVQMPGMDGNEATEEIRRQGFKGLIIALTAHVLREEHEKCFRAGCNDVLTKPISRSKLLEKLESLAVKNSGENPGRTAHSTEPSKSTEPLRSN